jgi:hypothetical protein
LAIDFARVAKPLIEARLKPVAAIGRANRGILGDRRRDCGRSCARSIAGPEIIVADCLIAGTARRRGVPAKGDAASGDAGADPA